MQQFETAFTMIPFAASSCGNGRADKIFYLAKNALITIRVWLSTNLITSVTLVESGDHRKIICFRLLVSILLWDRLVDFPVEFLLYLFLYRSFSFSFFFF